VTVAFQPDSGRLLLFAEDFGILVSSFTREGVAESNDAARLRESGVLRPDGPHPAVQIGLGTVLEPVCRLDACIVGGTTRLLQQGWFSPRGAAMLRHIREDEFEFLTVPPEFVPVALARMVRLGPRKTGGGREASELTGDCFEDLFSVEAERRTAARANSAASPAAGHGGWTWSGPVRETHSLAGLSREPMGLTACSSLSRSLVADSWFVPPARRRPGIGS